MLHQIFKTEAEKLKDNIVSFTQKLVQTPSLSGNEGHLAEIILYEMDRLGYDEAYIDEIGNVVGIIYGEQPGTNVMYLSPMDHLEPGDINLWKHDPYSGKIENDSIHGVGASDAKGSIVSQVYGGIILKNAKALKKGNYIVSCTVQESSAGCFGTKNLFSKTFKEKDVKVNFAVLGNATNLNVYIGQRGRVELELVIYGRTSHSIVPWLGINTIHKLAPVIRGLEDLIDLLPSHPMLEKSTLALTSVKTFPDKPNIIPDRCILNIDRRFFPVESIDEVKGQIQAIIDRLMRDDPGFKATLKIKTARIRSYKGYSDEIQKLMLPFFIDENHPYLQKIYPALKKSQENVNFGTWYFNTDGGFTSGILKIPTIGYAPGEEKYYNTPFDQISIDSLIKAITGNAVIHSTLN